ncbi:MAG: hypothetical protein ABSD74_17550 [Rhizomicrobium sp.]|jgi:hypothetical protein
MRACLLAFACVVALAGCGRNQDQQHTMTINGNGGGTVTMSGNGQNMTIKSSDGNASLQFNANGGQAPANLPSYASVYPGSKITTSMVGSDAHGNGGMMVEQTSASVADVIAFYKQKASASGFAETMNMNVGTETMFSATSGDKKQTLSVVATTQNGSTQAQITWGTK